MSLKARLKRWVLSLLFKKCPPQIFRQPVAFYNSTTSTSAPPGCFLLAISGRERGLDDCSDLFHDVFDGFQVFRVHQPPVLQMCGPNMSSSCGRRCSFPSSSLLTAFWVPTIQQCIHQHREALRKKGCFRIWRWRRIPALQRGCWTKRSVTLKRFSGGGKRGPPAAQTSVIHHRKRREWVKVSELAFSEPPENHNDWTCRICKQAGTQKKSTKSLMWSWMKSWIVTWWPLTVCVISKVIYASSRLLQVSLAASSACSLFIFLVLC